MTHPEIPDTVTPSAEARKKGHPHPLIEAGRAFQRTFVALEPGERATLRRADLPSTCAPFWECINAATQAARAAEHDQSLTPSRLNWLVPRLERLVPLLDLLRKLTTEDGASVGEFLRRNHDYVLLRRVEVLLAAEDFKDVVEQLESVAGIAQVAGLDVGILLRDLNNLHFNPDAVRRRWAMDYFASTLSFNR